LLLFLRSLVWPDRGPTTITHSLLPCSVLPNINILLCLFNSGRLFVCSYGFRLPRWYLQTISSRNEHIRLHTKDHTLILFALVDTLLIYHTKWRGRGGRYRMVVKARYILSFWMVFNATFNNISVISWQSVLLVEVTGENHQPAANHCRNFVTLSTPRYKRDSNS
jgi:hypothetical protein